ncbi:TonB-dependent receptor [Pedobacter nyackensis]|uniref:SusC/RagA family TonB-linked outer membrane protein n=1 Tax=Pedobacter nyackensis TaxID=475255 RepID=UPI00292EBF5B|nr:TonB-dependent receptor [Pedobacter nyackensis]
MKLNACVKGPRMRSPLALKLLLIMKLGVLLTFFGIFNASAGSFAQHITLKASNIALSKAMEQVKAQTGYQFFLIGKKQADTKVYIDVENASLDEAMTALLINLPFSWTLKDRTIVIRNKEPGALKPTIVAVQTEIKGTVKDKDGKPVPGVTITVAGTSRATSTDGDGHYVIKASIGETLRFKGIGFANLEIKVENKTIIDMVMQESQEKLDEVVVLGFGQSQKKIAQTGSLASISTKELKQSPVANVTNALAGRLPGLIAVQRSGEPGYDNSDLFIRGRSTFNNNSPLLTIDGVQKDYSAINLLDVNEIENITILKDASATALYGVKGANGVIIITTRRGKIGEPAIQATVQTAMQDPTRLPQILDAYNYALLSNEAYKNDNPTGILTPYSEIALEAYRTGINPLKYPNVNWMKEALKTSALTTANVNISGGTIKTRYFVNLGYTGQDGIYKSEKQPKYDPNVNFNRYNFRSNVDIDFDEDLSVSLNLFGAIENSSYPRSTASELFDMLMKVTPNAFPVKYPTGFYAQKPGLLNPFYWLNTQGYSQNFNSSLSGMVSVTRKLNFITEGLSLKGNYSFDGYFRNRFSRSKSERTALYLGTGDYNDLNSYTYTGEDIPLSAPSSSFSQNRDIWMDVSLNYARNFGDHAFTGLLLANKTQKVLGGEIPYVSQGLVSRVTYNYKNKYFAEFNAGFNGTDNFAKGKRYGFFPAFSAGWMLSEEAFLKNVSAINLLKLRGSYGLTGNDRLNGRRWLFISEFNDFSGYSFGEPLSWTSGVGEGAIANPAVSWEIARKSNLGFELKLWESLFGLNLDLYYEKRNDILITRGSVPTVIGIPGGKLAPVNFGSTENKGFELELNHRHHIGAINYFFRGNVSFSRNKIIFMDEEPKPFPYLSLTGHPLGQYFGLTALGFFKDETEIANSPQQFGQVLPGDIKYRDLNGDNIVDQNDAGPIGKSDLPEVFYGLSAGLNWKNFDFSCLFQGASGFNVMLSDQAAYEFVEGRNVLEEHLGRWTQETANQATYPRLHYGFNNNNHRPSSFFLKDASYIRLKNAELGYTFKNVQVTKRKSFSSIRIYTNGMNLFTWDKIGGSYDPEMRSGSGNNYPQQRIYNFGASVTF